MIASQFDLFLFDLDGVVYVGSEPLPYAIESLRRLRAKGKSIRFLTNNPCVTREGAVRRLGTLGIEAAVDEMISVAYATAHYLKTKDYRSVYVFSDEALHVECHRLGIRTDDTEHPEAVVVGWDGGRTLSDVQGLAHYIAKGAHLIMTSPDRTFPLPQGPTLATGALGDMFKMALGVEPVVIGKPHEAMFQFALSQFPEIAKERIVMLGDNPLTDILGAHQAGLSAILISGVEERPYPLAHDLRNPDWIMSNLSYLFAPGLSFPAYSPQDEVVAEEVKAAVTAVIFDEKDRVLLMKRRDNQLWGLPTGHVEVGESVEEAVLREVYEETGLKVSIERLLGVYSDPKTQTLVYPDGRATQFVTTCFVCQREGGTLQRETEEALDVAFFSPERLPERMLPMHPQRIIDALA